MEIKAIHGEAGYHAALAELDRIWDASKADRISRWMGKWKVGQNQPLCNRDSIVAHLEQQNSLTPEPWLNTY
ncbi:hypothetical protein [Acidithiobacillus sp.]|jgi:hypothetical protein|uniref:hypothetical protein n=1 Tax=Acidithiobacillus sp. TaxID=1872118 RepID=UPI0026244180|nr:hypothetical protein [Acidithiobacillus sp.]